MKNNRKNIIHKLKNKKLEEKIKKTENQKLKKKLKKEINKNDNNKEINLKRKKQLILKS